MSYILSVTFPFLVALFSLTILITVVLLIGLMLKPVFLRRNSFRIRVFYISWFIAYAVFVLFFTGPKDLRLYPSGKSSPYKLPWKAGVRRLVAQGNRSFTSHRDSHQYAWDFVMTNGAEILAARDGLVIEVEDSLDGIGFKSNFVTIVHSDGERSLYAHIQHEGALVKVGDSVRQGQPIALSGMVGQTLFPHVHFVVFTKEGTSSIPVSFNDVPGGVPLAGRFYISENGNR